jgi:hypothetical protein
VNRKSDRKRSPQVDRARDELFSHIHRCGVLQASEEHQVEWMEDTISYLGERYPELGQDDLAELRQIGMRFCQPVIRRAEEEPADESGVGEGEGMANEVAA